MKNSIKLIALLIAGFGHYASSYAMLNQPASVITKNIVNTIKNNEILSTEQIDQLLLLSGRSALSSDQKEILISIWNNASYKKSVLSFVNTLDEIALFFEQWEQVSLEDEQPVATYLGKREVLDLSLDNSDEERPVKKKPKEEIIQDDQDLEGDEEGFISVKKEDLICSICLEAYTNSSSTQKNINCCSEYHLFCNDCFSALQNKNICPKPGCGKEAIAYTNNSDDENYEFLQLLLLSCNRPSDGAKKQILQFLLKKSQNERGIESELQLPESDTELSDSDSSSDNDDLHAKHRNICSYCRKQIIGESVFPGCLCMVAYHRNCFDQRIDKRCPNCRQLVMILAQR